VHLNGTTGTELLDRAKFDSDDPTVVFHPTVRYNVTVKSYNHALQLENPNQATTKQEPFRSWSLNKGLVIRHSHSPSLGKVRKTASKVEHED
jgi:hypothetical protein